MADEEVTYIGARRSAHQDRSQQVSVVDVQGRLVGTKLRWHREDYMVEYTI